MLGILNANQIDHVLRSEVIGRIGSIMEGRVYIVPISYVYDGDCIYGHSAGGMKLSMMRAHPQICFEVEHVEDLANWQSVIAWGTFEELQGEESARGLQLFLDRMSPIRSSQTALSSHISAESGHGIDAHGQVETIFRVTLTEQTGRYERQD